MAEFLDGQTVIDLAAWIPVTDFWARFNGSREGFPWTTHEISRAMPASIPKTTVRRPDDGKAVRVWRGIKWYSGTHGVGE